MGRWTTHPAGTATGVPQRSEGVRVQESVQRVRFGPERVALLPVLIFLAGAVPLALSSPWLVWLLLLPVAAAVWVLRARVVVDGAGLEVCLGLGVRRVPWSEVEGVDLPRRGPARLLLRDGQRVRLPALSSRDVRRLLELAPRLPRAGEQPPDGPSGGGPSSGGPPPPASV